MQKTHNIFNAMGMPKLFKRQNRSEFVLTTKSGAAQMVLTVIAQRRRLNWELSTQSESYMRGLEKCYEIIQNSL